MDLVVNHTSDQHEWFRSSRRRERPYEDYYIWRDGVDGGPSNNWESFFGGSAWSYDEGRGQYYLHLFAEEQSDLNWEHPDVRADIYEMMSWWLGKGIDGFRMDVINLLSKRPRLPDGDSDGHDIVGGEHFVDGPRLHEFLDEVVERTFGDRRLEVVNVGEVTYVTPETALDVTGRRSDAIDMTVFFDHMGIDREGRWLDAEWDLDDVRDVFAKWQRAADAGAWPCLYLENHDQPRSVLRFGDPAFRCESATMLAAFLHSHRGTPFVYQGQEFGMTNASFDAPSDLRDIEARNYWRKLEAAGHEFDDVEEWFRHSRDNARTPVTWTDGPDAGFTDGDPWLDPIEEYRTVNAATDRASGRSILAFYAELIELRGDDVLAYGDFELVASDHEEIYAVHRSLESADHDLLVACNFFDGEPTLRTAPDHGSAEPVLGNYESLPETPEGAEFRPYEAVVHRLR